MPVVPRTPTPEYIREPTPEKDDEQGRAKRQRFTTTDYHRRIVDKLLSAPEKEQRLPANIEAALGAPKDIVKSVAGSSAAAGSGEFHVYKNARRREAERVRMMEETAKQLEEHQAFLARQAERDAVTEAKTAKNRAKRQKRKAGRKGDGASPAPTTANGAGGGSKLAGGGATAREEERVEEKKADKAPQHGLQSHQARVAMHQETMRREQEERGEVNGEKEKEEKEEPRRIEVPITVVDDD